jgi:hypothetical protein
LPKRGAADSSDSTVYEAENGMGWSNSIVNGISIMSKVVRVQQMLAITVKEVFPLFIEILNKLIYDFRDS